MADDPTGPSANAEKEIDYEFYHNNVIYRDSNFWQKYNAIADNSKAENNTKKAEDNRYYSETFLRNFLKKYVA